MQRALAQLVGTALMGRFYRSEERCQSQSLLPGHVGRFAGSVSLQPPTLSLTALPPPMV